MENNSAIGYIFLPNVKLVIKKNVVFFPFIALENESKRRDHEHYSKWRSRKLVFGLFDSYCWKSE